ncbi:hypothetical protein ACRRTK_013496 [Alexandromys fortis]
MVEKGSQAVGHTGTCILDMEKGLLGLRPSQEKKEDLEAVAAASRCRSGIFIACKLDSTFTGESAIRTAGTRTGPPRVKRRPAAGSSPSRPRGQADALTRPTAPWAHGGFPVTAATSDPRMRNACHELSPHSGCRAVGAPGRQEHQAAQMRAPLCLLLLLAHAVDMLALHRRKKQEGTKAQWTTWHYPEVESDLQLHSLLGTPTQDAQQNGKCQTGKDL